MDSGTKWKWSYSLPVLGSLVCHTCPLLVCYLWKEPESEFWEADKPIAMPGHWLCSKEFWGGFGVAQWWKWWLCQWDPSTLSLGNVFLPVYFSKMVGGVLCREHGFGLLGDHSREPAFEASQPEPMLSSPEYCELGIILLEEEKWWLEKDPSRIREQKSPISTYLLSSASCAAWCPVLLWWPMPGWAGCTEPQRLWWCSFAGRAKKLSVLVTNS